MKKRIIKAASLLMALTLAFSSAGAFTPGGHAEAKKKKKYTIVLDAGHDENHPGTRYAGLEEENITAKLAEYCQEYLEEDYNMKVFQARPEDECPVGGGREINCLEFRPMVAKKKKADLFVSFHINSSVNTVPSGVEVWTPTLYASTVVGKKSRDLASQILSKLLKLGFTNRGLKYANHVVTKKANEYGIPACLIEHGFVRNPSDRRWLSSNAKLKKMAKADADGIAAFLNMKVTYTDDAVDAKDDDSYDDEDGVIYIDGGEEKTTSDKKEEGVIYFDGSDDDDEVNLDGDDEDGGDDAKLNENSGAVFAAKKAGVIEDRVKMGVALPGDFNAISLSWTAYDNASKYLVFRKGANEKKKPTNA